MYKCKECGAEYNIKPDYCDCGNDEFEQILKDEVIKKTAQDEPKNKPEIKQTVKVEKPKTKKKSFNEQYPLFSRFIHSIDPISAIVFCVCILLSLYLVFFAWNPKEPDLSTQKTQEQGISKNIPTVDKFWNNSLPVVKPAVQKADVQPKQEPKAEPIKVSSPIVNTPKVTRVPLVKSVSTKHAQKQTNNNQNQLKKQQEDAKKKAEQEALAKKKAEQERINAENAQLKKLQEEQARKAQEEKRKQSAILKQELVSYKANLRNTIGRKIDFTRVIGDGSCTVAFKIDKNGKLINRSFAKQSSNNTLNDAVYNAVMATPSFNPPPEAYNNETLNLNISFKNGNFEISLP